MSVPQLNCITMKNLFCTQKVCLLLTVCVWLSACKSYQSLTDNLLPGYPDTIASNAFLYYRDLDKAVHFYTYTLGFRLVFEFPQAAAIVQTSPTTFLTLVQEDSGMHSADEPKTFAVSFVTDEIEAWYDYLVVRGVKFEHHIAPLSGRPHRGFVVSDPEGYFLEFKLFGVHPQNDSLMPRLNGSKPLYTIAGQNTSRPPSLGVKASVYWLYHEKPEQSQYFYQNTFGFRMLVDQGAAKIYPTSASGYLGLVESGKGMFIATPEKAVNISFFTTNIVAWFAHLHTKPDFTFRKDTIFEEEGVVRVIVGYDPENYFIEIDEFPNVEKNRLLRGALMMSTN